MATRCPNCDRGLGWRLLPSLSAAWQCRCGARVYHDASSFLEVWGRPAILAGFLFGSAAICALNYRGLVRPITTKEFVLLSAAAGVVLSAGFWLVLGPVALAIARLRRIPTLPANVAAAIASFVLCPALIWFFVGILRPQIEGPRQAWFDGNASNAAAETGSP